MDDFYCLIKLVKKKIEFYFIKNKSNAGIYNYPICFTGFTVNLLTVLIQSHELINFLSIDHWLYLGQELFKIEVAIFSGQEYIQK
uniref:DUF4346 domain-containing protein n=1 Tax=Caloglossa beccarii TaxID=131038 RepID=A0A1Z1M831_9FLOR|nr:hypothetical protein [Caloglossa beccarii]ARW62248.1 hypothetical protein [Caloglossa beccarii]